MSIKDFSTNNDAGNNFQSLSDLGWESCFQTQLEAIGDDNLFPARVVGVSKNSFLISQGRSEILVTVAGRVNYDRQGLFPVTGDWVLAKENVILKVLQRKNSLSRGAAGSRGKKDAQPGREQIIAANIDTIFIVCGLDRDFNIHRIERYLTLVYSCGLKPVIILTKADLQPDSDAFVNQVETVAVMVPVHVVSAKDSTGLRPLASYLIKGQTIAMIGSSGAGKSTLVNRLSGKIVQETGTVSESAGKGRHITTSRSLIQMPHGGMIIDNPGIREIALWNDDGGVESAFPEIETLAETCRFSNCSHMHEPGCKVLSGVERGEIKPDRLESYHKMKREMAYLSDRQHMSADRLEKDRWQPVAQKIKAMKNKKGRLN